MLPSLDVPPWFYADLTVDLQHPKLRALKLHWEDRKAGADLPHVDAIDPIDLQDHLGHLFMIRVDPGKSEYTYSLIGTTITEILGRDSTGMRVQDTFPDGHPIVEMYDYVCRNRVPIRTHGQLNWVDKDYKRFESVMLPLTDDDGAIVKILGEAIYTPETR